MKLLLVCLTFLILGGHLQAQKKKELEFRVIIDSDGGIDDARSIAYLLGRNEVKVNALIASEGNVSVKNGQQKLSTIANVFQLQIPVYGGYSIEKKAPAWRNFNELVSWGASIEKNPSNDISQLSMALKSQQEKFTYLCLGPMTNLAFLIKSDPAILKKMDRAIWYCGNAEPLSGFNFSEDEESANFVLNSGLRVDVVSNQDLEGAVFDTQLFNLAASSKSITGRFIYDLHQQSSVNERLNSGHFKFWDDLVSIYLLNPELFDVTPLVKNKHVRFARQYDVTAVRSVISDLLNSSYVVEKNIVFNAFPSQAVQFNYDVRSVMDTIIKRYGKEEWKACVMTDEFHGHLGVFSIVGAKMGVKACEYFNVGNDQMKVKSFAGLRPPYSCLTDGIQVSTGATLGMGTISVSNDTVTRPEALFSYQGRTIRLKLKPEYLKQVDADINEGIVKFGLMDDGYWKLIRRNAIKYWKEWDRNKIFDLEEVISSEKKL